MKYKEYRDCDVLISFKDGTFISLDKEEKISYGETGIYIKAASSSKTKVKFIPYVNMQYLDMEWGN